MILFHISHTDLDGYSCHLLSKEYFKEAYYLNANYGAEVKSSIVFFLEKISTENIKDEILFLITDLNLTLPEAKFLSERISTLNEEGFNIKLQLLDHHITGQKCADKYDWYYLDISRCATKIYFEYLQKEFNLFKEESYFWLKKIVDSVNAIDIWVESETKNFEFGKVLLGMVSHVREINNVLFADDNRNFRIYLIKEAAKYIDLEDGNIKLDDDIHKIKKEYLKLDSKNDTLDNLSAKYLVNSINEIKDNLTVTYQDKKGVLTYTLGSISIPANAFLKANPDFDFFIDVSKKGNAGFRANGNINVGELAEKLANGGGHPNASGCKFDDFKESIHYEDIKSYIQTKLDNLK